MGDESKLDSIIEMMKKNEEMTKKTQDQIGGMEGKLSGDIGNLGQMLEDILSEVGRHSQKLELLESKSKSTEEEIVKLYQMFEELKKENEELRQSQAQLKVGYSDADDLNRIDLERLDEVSKAKRIVAMQPVEFVSRDQERKDRTRFTVIQGLMKEMGISHLMDNVVDVFQVPSSAGRNRVYVKFEDEAQVLLRE